MIRLKQKDRTDIAKVSHSLPAVAWLFLSFWFAAPAFSEHTEAVPFDVSHPGEATQPQIHHEGDDAVLNGEIEKTDFKTLSGLCKRCGFEIAQVGKDLCPCKITSVKPNSPASRRGLEAGDLLISQSEASNGPRFTVEHKNQGMRFNISTAELDRYSKTLIKSATGTNLAASNPIKAQPGPPPQFAAKAAYKTAREIFENHDLVIMIDTSGSMHERDCPGGLTRWDWVGKQASDLAEAAQSASSNITAVLFNHDYQTFRHLTAAQIPSVFAKGKPFGETELAQPLQDELTDYFRTRARPLIVVIISDGMPTHPQWVASVIKDASSKLTYRGEVSITFALIGDSSIDEESLLKMIGEKKGSSIASGGMIDIIPFEKVAHAGLKQSLFEELKTVRLATNRSMPSTAASYSAAPNNSVEPEPNFEAASERTKLENALLNKYR